MWQLVEILNLFNTLTLKQIFWKMKTFFKKLEYRFLIESPKLETHHFHTKLPKQKPMIRQIEWWVQNGHITKNGVLPVTILFFGNFVLFQEPLITRVDLLYLRINCPYSYFSKSWSFIWRCFFLVRVVGVRGGQGGPASPPPPNQIFDY